jgi:hypothetical protein
MLEQHTVVDRGSGEQWPEPPRQRVDWF